MIKIIANLPKAYLSRLLSMSLDQALSTEALEIKGFDINLARHDVAMVTARAKSIFIDVPLKVHISKDAGLFSIDAQGIIMISVTSAIDISTNLTINTQSEIAGWKWIEEPKVKIGVLNLPISAIANVILHKVDDDISQKLDEAIAQHIDLQRLINQKLAALVDSRKVSDEPPLYLMTQIEEIQCAGMREYNDKIELPLYIELQNQLSDQYQVATDWDLPRFAWILDEPLEHIQTLDLVYRYESLAEAIRQKMDGIEVGGKQIKISKVTISHDDLIHIRIQITDPIESVMTIAGQPSIINGELHLGDLEVEMNTPNILYKMTSPIIEKFIRSYIEDQLPIPINSLLRTKVNEGVNQVNQSSHLELHLDDRHFVINDVQLVDEKLMVSVAAQDIELKVLIDEDTSSMTIS